MAKKNNYTRYVISLIVVGFTFYMYTAVPIPFLEYNKNPRKETLKKYERLNNTLNNEAKEIKETYVLAETADTYYRVEQMPRFASCEYLEENNARICTKNQIDYFNLYIIQILSSYNRPLDWTLLISFVINEYGYINDIKPLNNDFKEFSEVAIRELEKMPKFASPGYQNNRAVKVKYIIQLTKN